jgi:hypothetical protein
MMHYFQGGFYAREAPASFYPVGNGDTSQIVLSQGRKVLFDFCHRKKADGADTPEIDLKKRLKEQ